MSMAQARRPGDTGGTYAVRGKKVKIVQSKDKHRLWSDLYEITESQISLLKEKADNNEELDSKEMSKLDSCFNGLKKLLEIETQLKSTELAQLSNQELERLVAKAVRERKAKAKQIEAHENAQSSKEQ